MWFKHKDRDAYIFNCNLEEAPKSHSASCVHSNYASYFPSIWPLVGSMFLSVPPIGFPGGAENVLVEKIHV